MRPLRLLFEGTSTEKYYAYITDFNIGVSLVAVLASALIRNVGISVLNAATDAERARVEVEMV